MEKQGKEPPTVRAVDRALEIMSLFDDESNTLTLKEVLDKTELPKTTAVRLLQTLEQNGMLQASGNGEYVGGLSLLRWAQLAARTWMIPTGAAEILATLAERCRETVNVYARRGIHRVCIAQREGPQTLRQVVHVGDELPLWGGGAAKILLLDASDALLASVAASSPSGPDHIATLKHWIKRARVDGYATSRAEREVGLSSIAVPVSSSGGVVLAALSLGGPSERFTDDRRSEMAAELLSSAQALEEGRFFEHLPVPRQ